MCLDRDRLHVGALRPTGCRPPYLRCVPRMSGAGGACPRLGFADGGRCSSVGVGWWTRSRVVAVDGASGIVGGAVRRQFFSAGRFGAIKSCQYRVSTYLCADAVQIPFAGAAHHHDVAAQSDAGKLRHPGSGAAAARAPLVHRKRRHDFAVVQRGVRRRTTPFTPPPTAIVEPAAGAFTGCVHYQRSTG